MRDRSPLELGAASRELEGARTALQPPTRRPLPVWIALACAALMAAAALTVAAVVLLGGWEPEARPAPTSVHGPLAG